MEDTHWTPLTQPDKLRTVKSVFTPQLGVVSDEPARSANHPVGNAGLFSTADDLAKYCLMILNGGRIKRKTILSKETIQLMSSKPDNRSPASLGWQINPKDNPGGLSEKTLTHTGFTGNSVWIDLDQKKYIIILTNRTGDHGISKQARIKFAENILKFSALSDLKSGFRY
jgi:serine-type D-Ala-D-Ala carboxypeptidase